MSDIRKTTRVVALLVGAGLLALAAPAAASRPSVVIPPTRPGLTYVALGDSYAAGYGIGSSTGKPVAGCAQSTQDYPHQVAATLHLALTDVSCSGAVTADIDTTPQQTPAGTAPLQDSVLSRSTDVVTLTIGGNDLGFSSIAATCLAETQNGPLAVPALQNPPQIIPNCRSVFVKGTDDTLADRITAVVAPNLTRVLADIKAKAPAAKVFVLDYPAISTVAQYVPKTLTGCFSPVSVTGPNSFPFTTVDTGYLQQVQADLNARVKAQAAAAGATFVETYPQSLPHSACTGTPDPWMNGIGLTGVGVTAYPGSLHPNLQGATAMAAVLAPTIAAAFPVTTPASSAPAPSSSSGTPSGTAAASSGPAASSSTAPLANTGTARPAAPLALLGGVLLVLGAVLSIAFRRSGHPRR